tara:strand:+ start:6150 stop:6494 length:345 start_codon:yes stop_codon:yes gene_type:complete
MIKGHLLKFNVKPYTVRSIPNSTLNPLENTGNVIGTHRKHGLVDSRDPVVGDHFLLTLVAIFLYPFNSLKTSTATIVNKVVFIPIVNFAMGGTGILIFMKKMWDNIRYGIRRRT